MKNLFLTDEPKKERDSNKPSCIRRIGAVIVFFVIGSFALKAIIATFKGDPPEKIKPAPYWLFDYQNAMERNGAISVSMPDEDPVRTKYEGMVCYTGSCEKFEFSNGSSFIINNDNQIMNAMIFPPEKVIYSDDWVKGMRFDQPNGARKELDTPSAVRWLNREDRSTLSFFMNDDGTLYYIAFTNPFPPHAYKSIKDMQ